MARARRFYPALATAVVASALCLHAAVPERVLKKVMELMRSNCASPGGEATAAMNTPEKSSTPLRLNTPHQHFSRTRRLGRVLGQASHAGGRA